MLLIGLIYLIGVLVARIQLRFWLKDQILLKEDHQTVVMLSALSWAIYPAYLIEKTIDNLNTK